MSVSRDLIYFELLKCNGGKLTNIMSAFHQNWRMNCFYMETSLCSVTKEAECSEKVYRYVLLRTSLFSEIHVPLYD